jgi:hypothetical protein
MSTIGKGPVERTPVSALKGMSKPATRALVAIGVEWLEQLSGRSERELAGLHGMGPKALRVIRDALEERGEGLAP